MSTRSRTWALCIETNRKRVVTIYLQTDAFVGIVLADNRPWMSLIKNAMIVYTQSAGETTADVQTTVRRHFSSAQFP